VEGRFLQADDLAGLCAEATRAGARGAGAVFLSDGPLGDPFVVAAGLAPLLPGMLLGARTRLTPEGRHPAMLAREVTSLDLACGGRSVLCFVPPFTDALPEAIDLCRAMWRPGEVASDGPFFPVHAAASRPRPMGAGSPRIALDLTAGDELPPFLVGAADLILRPIGGGADGAAACRLERV
jgi:alkanesulfonate monooxygenase SsuD/methylene tetrahydromethanopterin reductase-like flavin-dependent oxidoreductase (luciferase family)